MKNLIRHAPALDMFDLTLATVLTTDASDVGCGACLAHIGRAGEMRVVAYASKSFSPAEHEYSVDEKEALSCEWVCEKWRHCLWVGGSHLGPTISLSAPYSDRKGLTAWEGASLAGKRVF